ncbi:MAG: CCA tRNA nucleotidyltransferase [Methanomassiliicoccales archaeon]|nr:CCA tRNA nucleotidyltransferase [Methanomassiliicoccales archaeon]
MPLQDEILSRLRPNQELMDRLSGAVDRLCSRTKEVIAGTGMPLQTMLVGSVAKGTFVGNPDIDLFLLFPPSTERAQLERVGLDIGKEVLDGETRYAEHPYTHGVFEGFEVDLVPCYHLSDLGQLRSAVDRTPFHTRYVLSRLSEVHREQVLLLKQFMKGVGVYGAEARVQGFSGYLTELLILTYGDFSSLLHEASGWRPGLGLDVEGRRKGGGPGPLTFTDPVDPKRNVASALSLDRMALFIHACREYLRRPDERFFFPREREVLGLDTLREAFRLRGTAPLVVTLDRPDMVDDNLYPQVQRSLQGLRKLLESYDFKVLDSTYAVGRDVRLAYELENAHLPPGRLHQGPPSWSENSPEFLDKWRENGLGQPFLVEDRWYVHILREFREPVSLLNTKGREAALGNGFRDLGGMRVVVKGRTYRESNRQVLSRMVDKRENWRV